MNSLISALAVLALLGSALIGGVFFAFSSFVMKALARVPSSEGMAAMQSINVVVINPSFLGTFMGTAFLCIAVIVLVLVGDGHPGAAPFLGGAALYFAGTFLITIFGNVPLNDRLAATSVTDADAVSLWLRYLDRWTKWNHARTVAAVGSTMLFTIGLMQNGG